ncbi:hypothetical protein MBLNU459_g0867t2 [Dothideomycetes sp. NU459]
MRQTCIFSGSSHPSLADSVCERLGKTTDKVELRKFANGETSVEIKTSVRDQDVFIVQSGSNKYGMLIMINACKGGSARSVTAVMPYFPYSRQSKKKSHRGSITARMIANLMHVAGVNHVITIDLHASQMQGFFKCPVDNLVAEPILARWIKTNVRDWKEAVVVSKNPGGTKRVTSLADALKLSFGIVTTDRRRPHPGNSMFNSVIFDSVTPVEILSRSDPQVSKPASAGDDAHVEAHSSDAHDDGPIEHDFAPHGEHSKPSDYSNSESVPDSFPRRPGKTRTHAPLALGVANRLANGGSAIPPSPLAQSVVPDSMPSSPGRSAEVESGEEASRGAAPLQRVHTAIATTQPPPEPGHESEDETDEYTDERARNVITGRLIQGHIVDDDYPSPVMSAMSASTHTLHARRSSEDDLPENMLSSFVSTASSHHRHDGGLGGTGDATASDDEEEEALQDPELETTITLVGNVRNRPVFIVDDIMDKPGSWIAAAETAVKRGGATRVYCMATHALLGGEALREMDECDEIDYIVVTNAFPIPEEKSRGIKKLVVLDVSYLLAEAIRRNHHGESISQLFHHYD